jgi:HAD superfamily hydrolase (TIGR01549 family)
MMKLKGIIFDMDGTIVDAPYDWNKIREDLGTQGKPILAFIQGLVEDEQSKKWKILESYERRATEKATIKKGMPELLELIRQKKIKTALVTNNSKDNVDYLINKFKLSFDLIISREDRLWKPSGAPFLAVLEAWKIKKTECCVVGDSPFDIKAAEDAGIDLVFILGANQDEAVPPHVEQLVSVQSLQEKLKNLL